MPVREWAGPPTPPHGMDKYFMPSRLDAGELGEMDQIMSYSAIGLVSG